MTHSLKNNTEDIGMNNIQLDHNYHQAKNRTFPICFLAHNIDSPMNIGSLFRIADALGVERIYLSGTSATPPNSKIRKTSRSTEKYVNFVYENDPIVIVNDLKSEGYIIVSLEITSSSIDISEISLSGNEKICLVVGSEKAGICEELLEASDHTTHIPMMGQNSSMNVASACSIATYEIIKSVKK